MLKSMKFSLFLIVYSTLLIEKLTKHLQFYNSVTKIRIPRTKPTLLLSTTKTGRWKLSEKSTKTIQFWTVWIKISRKHQLSNVCQLMSKCVAPMLSETVPTRQAFQMRIQFFLYWQAWIFELYSGQQNQKCLETEPSLGASANHVICLMRCVPTNQNHKIFFANY
jgi:hypothetical protein